MLVTSLLTAAGLGGAGLAAGYWKSRQFSRTHPPEAEFVDVDGTRLHYRRTGDPAKPALLVLHGAASNLEEPHFALSETFGDEHVIWLDRPGLGWSERPEGSWSPQREADLIAVFLETIDISETVVMGHSWGGAISMRLAMDHPDRVGGLVLVAPALSAWIGRAAWFNAASYWPVLGPIITRLVVPLTGEAQLRSGAVNAFHPEVVPEEYSTRSSLPLLLRPENWLANAADMRDVNRHLEEQEKRYAQIDKPAIFLAGRGDTVLWTDRHSGVVSRRMPQGELRLIKGAGHNLHHHHPDRVLDAVRDVRQRASKLPNLVEITGPAG